MDKEVNIKFGKSSADPEFKSGSGYGHGIQAGFALARGLCAPNALVEHFCCVVSCVFVFVLFALCYLLSFFCVGCG